MTRVLILRDQQLSRPWNGFNALRAGQIINVKIMPALDRLIDHIDLGRSGILWRTDLMGDYGSNWRELTALEELARVADELNPD